MKEKSFFFSFVCFVLFVVQMLFLTGCETQPVKSQSTIHKERGRDVYKGWAVTGCVATMESGQHATGDRGLMIDLCRSMTDLYQKNQCRITIPVRRAGELGPVNNLPYSHLTINKGRTTYVHP